MTSRRNLLAAPILYKLVQRTGTLHAAQTAQLGAGLRFGFIGIGIRGMYLLEEFQKLGVTPAIAADVYDGHLTRARELTNGAIETTRDYRRVLDNQSLDAIVIATPDHWHHRMALDSLAAGKHVYLEKPMAWSIEQNVEIANAFDSSKKLIQIGSGAKTAAITAKARELVKSGVLGKVSMVRMSMNRNTPEGAWVYAVPPDASPATIDWERFLGPAPKRDFDPNVFFRWRCWWEYSGGVATDLFVHMLTLLHEVMDVSAPLSVVSQGGIYRWKDGRTVPDVMNSLYEYPNEFLAEIFVNLTSSYGERGMVVIGSEGTMVIGPTTITIHPEARHQDIQRYATAAWPKAMRDQYFAAHPRTPAPQPKPKEIPVADGPSHHEYFVRSLRDGSKSREDAWEGHAAASSAHLANIAYRKGRRVSWDWKTGQVS